MERSGLGLRRAWADIPRLQHEAPGITAYMRERAAAEGCEAVAPSGWTCILNVSACMIGAIVGAEDPAFFQHRGIWWSQLARQICVSTRHGKRITAVSTITQQLARNVYLRERRSIKRKLSEMLLARRCDAILDKARILELYMNVVEWGPRTWGIENAARIYCDTTPNALNPFQAAVLASLLPAPRAPLTGKNFTRAHVTQRGVLQFLYSAGVISLVEWGETRRRLELLDVAVNGSTPPIVAIRTIGSHPYRTASMSDVPPTARDLLDTRCGERLRSAYDTYALGPATKPGWHRLPYRWNGRLPP